MSDKPTIRGRCKCGKLLRIRNARAEQVVRCPACKRTINITAADLRAAAAGATLELRQSMATAAPEALPLAFDELRPAPHGSQPGVTGRAATHDESLASELLGRPAISENPTPDVPAGALDVETLRSLPRLTLWKNFLTDLLMSFAFAGKLNNLILVACTAIACFLPTLIGLIPMMGLVTGLLMLLWSIVVGLYIVHFFWSTMTRTASGEDDIPLVEPDWSLWDDGVVPLFWLALVSVLCFAPAGYVHFFMEDSVRQGLLLIGALLLGALVWPVAVLSIALGDSLLYLRPDWLVRCILGIGPVYFVAWVFMLITVAVWTGLSVLEPPADIPILMLLYFPVAWFVELYFGYVLFRMLGLLYRHFRHRLPWDF